MLNEITHYKHRKKGRNIFIEVKVDMQKAFDRMKWNVLVHILVNLGYCHLFIYMVM